MSDEINVNLTAHENHSESALSFDEIESLTETKSDEEAVAEAVKLTEEKEEEQVKEEKAVTLDEKNSTDAEKREAIEKEGVDDAVQELQDMDYKKVSAAFRDTNIDVPTDSVFKHKVEGKEVDVTLQELLNNYAGKVPYDKKFNELAKSRKEHEAEVKQINEYINNFSTKLKNNDVLGALSYFAEFGGMSPLEFKAKLQESMFPKFEQFRNMSEEQKKALALQEENEYLKSKQTSFAEQEARKQADAALESELRQVQESHGLEEADLVRLYDELAENYKGEITPKVISEYYVNLQAYEKTDKLLSEIDPSLVNNDTDVEKIAKAILENPEIPMEEWREIVQEAYGKPKKASSNSKKVSDKVRTNRQEEYVTSETQLNNYVTSFDEL